MKRSSAILALLSIRSVSRWKRTMNSSNDLTATRAGME
jgi:hypothetical protein